MWEIATWVYAAGMFVVLVLLAYGVAVLAEDRGLPPLPWFVVGFFFPVFSLAGLLIWSALDRPAVPAAPWPPERSDDELGFGGAAATSD